MGSGRALQAIHTQRQKLLSKRYIVLGAIVVIQDARLGIMIELDQEQPKALTVKEHTAKLIAQNKARLTEQEIDFLNRWLGAEGKDGQSSQGSIHGSMLKAGFTVEHSGGGDIADNSALVMRGKRIIARSRLTLEKCMEVQAVNPLELACRLKEGLDSNMLVNMREGKGRDIEHKIIERPDLRGRLAYVKLAMEALGHTKKVEVKHISSEQVVRDAVAKQPPTFMGDAVVLEDD